MLALALPNSLAVAALVRGAVLPGVEPEPVHEPIFPAALVAVARLEHSLAIVTGNVVLEHACVLEAAWLLVFPTALLLAEGEVSRVGRLAVPGLFSSAVRQIFLPHADIGVLFLQVLQPALSEGLPVPDLSFVVNPVAVYQPALLLGRPLGKISFVKGAV